MATDEIQPTRIDKAEYLAFKEWVQEVHGKTRGHLSTEIENALREYRQPNDTAEPLTRIEQDIATIKARLVDAEADGGVVATAAAPSCEPTHTHTPDVQPAANAPRAKKVEYLIDQKYDRDGGSIRPDTIKKDVKELYGFDDRTSPKYIQPVIDALDAKRHPNNSDILVWGEVEDNLRKSLSDCGQSDG